MNKVTENNLNLVEALLESVIQEATKLKKKCHKARVALAGVSTPAVRKGPMKISPSMIVIAKRNAKILNQIDASK